jgi:hypothetical protein
MRRSGLPSSMALRFHATLPNAGRRTIKGLAESIVPARTTWVVAGLALLLALGLHGASGLLQSQRLSVWAHVFEVLPIWLLLGASVHQVGTRLVQGWDDWHQWRRNRGRP